MPTNSHMPLAQEGRRVKGIIRRVQRELREVGAGNFGFSGQHQYSHSHLCEYFLICCNRIANNLYNNNNTNNNTDNNTNNNTHSNSSGKTKWRKTKNIQGKFSNGCLANLFCNGC